MSDRSKVISRLRNSLEARTSYIKSKLGILVPSQIRALRLQSQMPRQSDLAKAAKMQQSRISMFETPGAANVTLETLARLAAAFRVGLLVKFVPFSEMLEWENSYSQDTFSVTPIEDDTEFVNPAAFTAAGIGSHRRLVPLATLLGTGGQSFGIAQQTEGVAPSSAQVPVPATPVAGLGKLPVRSVPKLEGICQPQVVEMGKTR